MEFKGQDTSKEAEEAAVKRDADLAERMGLPPSEAYIRNRYRRARRDSHGS